MKKLFFLGVALATTLARAETLTAKIVQPTQMEVTRGKGMIMLKAGTVVEVVGQEGEVLAIVYHNITGLVPAAQTDFKGQAPKMPAKGAASEPAQKPKITRSSEAKPAEEKPAAPTNPNRDAPASDYGKMVKKARDVEAKHNENMVEPTDRAAGKN